MGNEASGDATLPRSPRPSRPATIVLLVAILGLTLPVTAQNDGVDPSGTDWVTTQRELGVSPAIRLSDDGLELYAAVSSRVEAFNTSTWISPYSLIHSANVEALAVGPNGTLVATMTDDRVVTEWKRTQAGWTKTEFRDHQTEPSRSSLQDSGGFSSTPNYGVSYYLALSPSGRFLASGTDWGGHVRVWDLEQGIQWADIHAGAGGLVFVSDRVLAVLSGSSLGLYSVDTARLVEGTEVPRMTSRAPSLTPVTRSGESAIQVGLDDSLFGYPAELTGTPNRTYVDGLITSIDYLAGCGLIVVTTDSASGWLVSVTDQMVVARFQLPSNSLVATSGYCLDSSVSIYSVSLSGGTVYRMEGRSQEPLPLPRPIVVTPSPGSTLSDIVTVSGTLDGLVPADNVLTVLVRVDGGRWSDSRGLREWKVDIETFRWPDGEHHITAVVTDGAYFGPTGDAVYTFLNRDSAASGETNTSFGWIAVSKPRQGETVSGTLSVYLIADLSGDFGGLNFRRAIVYFRAGSDHWVPIGSPPGALEFSFDTTRYPNGETELQARIESHDGALTIGSNVVVVSFANDQIEGLLRPEIYFVAPTEGSTINASSEFICRSPGGAIGKVVSFRSEVSDWTSVTPRWVGEECRFLWPVGTQLSSGRHLVYLKVSDGQLESAPDVRSVWVVGSLEVSSHDARDRSGRRGGEGDRGLPTLNTIGGGIWIAVLGALIATGALLMVLRALHAPSKLRRTIAPRHSNVSRLDADAVDRLTRIHGSPVVLGNKARAKARPRRTKFRRL